MRNPPLPVAALVAWYSLTACACSGTHSVGSGSVGGGNSTAGAGGPSSTGGGDSTAGTGGFATGGGTGIGGNGAETSTGGSVSGVGGAVQAGGTGGTDQAGGTGGADPGLGGNGGGEPCEADHGEEVPSLAQYYADYFAIGAAIDTQYEEYSETILEHFNSITTENEMKFESLQPSEGNFTFDTADRMVEFATSNGMQVRGHALVWHNQTPDWVFSGSSEQVLERMRNHIQTVMQHFQGKVQTWDVVNEALMDDGSYRDEEGGSAWYGALGESYIAEAFRAARQADPTAKLFYNDYANYYPPRRQGIYDMLAGLIEDGVPIDGVGLQAHLHLEPGPDDLTPYQTVEELETAVLMYSSLGLDVQITEMDVSLYVRGIEYTEDTRYTPENVTPELFEQQAERYRQFFEMFRKHGDLISSVTFWGIVDSNTWLSERTSGQQDFPLLFDAQQQPKPAFWALVDFCN